VFHIKYRRKVSRFKMYLVQIELGLLYRVYVGYEEMICTANEVVLLCLIEIEIEIIVHEAHAFGGLDDDKTYGVIVHAGIPKGFPVNLALVMADVQSANVVSFRIDRVTVHGFPAEAVWTNKKIVDKEDVGETNTEPPYPICPCGNAKEPFQEGRLSLFGIAGLAS
jgi:hypothetical protein